MIDSLLPKSCDDPLLVAAQQAACRGCSRCTSRASCLATTAQTWNDGLDVESCTWVDRNMVGETTRELNFTLGLNFPFPAESVRRAGVGPLRHAAQPAASLAARPTAQSAAPCHPHQTPPSAACRANTRPVPRQAAPLVPPTSQCAQGAWQRRRLRGGQALRELPSPPIPSAPLAAASVDRRCTATATQEAKACCREA